MRWFAYHPQTGIIEIICLNEQDHFHSRAADGEEDTVLDTLCGNRNRHKRGTGRFGGGGIFLGELDGS